MPPFKKSLLSLVAATALTVGLAACGGSDDDTVTQPPVSTAPAAAAFAMTAFVPVNGVAEIVAATPDGLTLVYTSADAGTIGLVDITDPAAPKTLPTVDVRKAGVGEPTSVAITPDGKFAIVAVRMNDDVTNANPGLLRVYDLSNKSAVTWVKDITVGVGPDSIALVGSTTTLRAVVAIEDEETLPSGDASIPGVRPGRIDVVGLEDLPGYGGTSTGVKSLELVTALKAAAGVNHPDDPQPEFVSVRAGTATAVVSLQENNAVALVDLSDPKTPKLKSVYSTGTVTRTGDADIRKDTEISFTDSFTGRREADAVAWLTDTVFATANEGDTAKGADGVFPGGRGFTLFDTTGKVVYEGGASTELHAVQYGHYPDSRSAAKGVEIEGVATATYGGTPFLFVGSERGGFVEVHRLDSGTAPTYVQMLPTGMSPEGLATITGRADGKQLFVTANEGDGSLNLYQFYPNGPTPNAAEPQIAAKDATIPWGALSGLTTDGTYLYAVPDNAFGQSRIWRLNAADVAKGRITIDKVIPLTLAGAKFNADAEGIAVLADGSFWVAMEGTNVAGNELVKVTADGVVTQRVKLSAAIQAKFANANNTTGFEGVTASADGNTLYVALQRGFDITKPFAAVLKYDVPTDTWTSAQYPLEQHSVNPTTYWMGLSEIQLTTDGRLLLIERDKGGGEGRAINAEVKRIYSVPASAVVDGATLTKTLVRDLRKDYRWLHEKAEGMVVFKGDLWVVNDNDGGGWTRMLNTGKL